jgi:hypothetical protein
MSCDEYREPHVEKYEQAVPPVLELDVHRQPSGNAHPDPHGAAWPLARHHRTPHAGRSTMTKVHREPAAERPAIASWRRRPISCVGSLAVGKGSPVLDHLLSDSLLSILGSISGEAVDHMEDVGGDALGHLQNST